MCMISKIVDWAYPLTIDPKRTPEAVLKKTSDLDETRGNVPARMNGVISEMEHDQIIKEARKPNFRDELAKKQEETQERVRKLTR